MSASNRSSRFSTSSTDVIKGKRKLDFDVETHTVNFVELSSKNGFESVAGNSSKQSFKRKSAINTLNLSVDLNSFHYVKTDNEFIKLDKCRFNADENNFIISNEPSPQKNLKTGLTNQNTINDSSQIDFRSIKESFQLGGINKSEEFEYTSNKKSVNKVIELPSPIKDEFDKISTTSSPDIKENKYYEDISEDISPIKISRVTSTASIVKKEVHENIKFGFRNIRNSFKPSNFKTVGNIENKGMLFFPNLTPHKNFDGHYQSPCKDIIDNICDTSPDINYRKEDNIISEEVTPVKDPPSVLTNAISESSMNFVNAEQVFKIKAKPLQNINYDCNKVSKYKITSQFKPNFAEIKNCVFNDVSLQFEKENSSLAKSSNYCPDNSYATKEHSRETKFQMGDEISLPEHKIEEYETSKIEMGKHPIYCNYEESFIVNRNKLVRNKFSSSRINENEMGTKIENTKIYKFKRKKCVEPWSKKSVIDSPNTNIPQSSGIRELININKGNTETLLSRNAKCPNNSYKEEIFFDNSAIQNTSIYCEQIQDTSSSEIDTLITNEEDVIEGTPVKYLRHTHNSRIIEDDTSPDKTGFHLTSIKCNSQNSMDHSCEKVDKLSNSAVIKSELLLCQGEHLQSVGKNMDYLEKEDFTNNAKKRNESYKSSVQDTSIYCTKIQDGPRSQVVKINTLITNGYDIFQCSPVKHERHPHGLNIKKIVNNNKKSFLNIENRNIWEESREKLFSSTLGGIEPTHWSEAKIETYQNRTQVEECKIHPEKHSPPFVENVVNSSDSTPKYKQIIIEDDTPPDKPASDFHLTLIQDCNSQNTLEYSFEKVENLSDSTSIEIKIPLCQEEDVQDIGSNMDYLEMDNFSNNTEKPNEVFEEFNKKRIKKGSLLERAYKIAINLKNESTLFSHELNFGLRSLDEGNMVSDRLRVSHLRKEEETYFLKCTPLQSTQDGCDLSHLGLTLIVTKLPDDIRLNSIFVVHFPVSIIFKTEYLETFVFVRNRIKSCKKEIVNIKYEEVYFRKCLEKNKLEKKIIRTLSSRLAKNILDSVVGFCLVNNSSIELTVLHKHFINVDSEQFIQLIAMDSEREVCILRIELSSLYHKQSSIDFVEGYIYEFTGFKLFDVSLTDNKLLSLIEYKTVYPMKSDTLYYFQPIIKDWEVKFVKENKQVENNLSTLLTVKHIHCDYRRLRILVERWSSCGSEIRLWDRSLSEKEYVVLETDVDQIRTRMLPFILECVYYFKGHLIFDTYSRISPPH